MKPFTKIFLKVIAVIITIAVIGSYSIYLYVSNQWKKYYNQQEMNEFVKMIDNSPVLSTNFYLIYDKLHHNDRHKSILRIFSRAIWTEMIIREHESTTCWYFYAVDFLKDGDLKHNKRYTKILLAFGLQKFTTPEKCFDYAMNVQNEYLSKQFKDYVIPDIKTLYKTDDILEYLVISRSPSLYKRRPDAFKNSLKLLKEELNEQ